MVIKCNNNNNNNNLYLLSNELAKKNLERKLNFGEWDSVNDILEKNIASPS